MIGPIDDNTEHLLEAYARNRLQGDATARVEAMIRAQPALLARVNELRDEARQLSGALLHCARENAEPIEDTTLALLIDDALDEMDRASLEASLAGDLAAQARLAALYREVAAIRNDEPLPDVQDISKPTDTVHPFEPKPQVVTRHIEVNGLLISVGLVVLSLIAPASIGVPVLFVALGIFAWWTMQSAGTRASTPVARRRSYAGLLPALLVFAAGLLAGPLSLWCYVCSAAWYWYWLVQRWAPRVSDSLALDVAPDEIDQQRIGGGKG
ncbi:MAG: hypothetical protein HUU46_17205 [Candidatus Hydrogenedentes bacterium]|nr:hypothetical protein [Candidatus Hydrogenedentota bacterium]